MPEPTIQELAALLEARIIELEHQRRIREDQDVALLARVDDFTNDLKRIERVQLRSFEEQHAHQEYVTGRFAHVEARLDTVEDHLGAVESHLTARLDTVEEHLDTVENHLTARLDTVEDHLTSLTKVVISHKEALEALYKGQQSLIAGQEQILAILTGKPKTND